MQKTFLIRLKAAFLLIIFTLNIMVGFACSMGIEMGFNSSHHHDEEEMGMTSGGHNLMHHHDEEGSLAHKHAKGGCCNDSVIKILQTDKAVTQAGAIISPVFFTSFTLTYFSVSFLYTSQVTTSTKYFVQSYHPPIADIRIAIQSFQI